MTALTVLFGEVCWLLCLLYNGCQTVSQGYKLGDERSCAQLPPSRLVCLWWVLKPRRYFCSFYASFPYRR